MEKIVYDLEDRAGIDLNGFELCGRDIWGEHIIIPHKAKNSLRNLLFSENAPETMYRLVEYHEDTGLSDVEMVIDFGDRIEYAAEFYMDLIREAGW
jgi:hypothetical protein